MSQQDNDIRTPDAVRGSWVGRWAPPAARPYLRLARLDRPIGSWLLLWPCWWSITLATPADSWPDPWLLALFAAGALLMRGAGCTLNDIADRDFDAAVARTRARPIASGQVSRLQAALFMGALAAASLLILLTFNAFAVKVGVASLLGVAVYPFMKRITYWPQIVLGLAFNWGALLGWAAVKGELSAAPVLLYVGGIFWTLGYDTIYAHQDKEDDLLVGIKSSALKLGENTVPALFLFYGGATLLFAEAGRQAGTGVAYYLALVGLAVHFIWQIGALDIADSRSCLQVFKSNSHVGWILFAGAVAGLWY
jgi:4-hydroxybenzoate polyprenyltransferase